MRQGSSSIAMLLVAALQAMNQAHKQQYDDGPTKDLYLSISFGISYGVTQTAIDNDWIWETL